MVNMNSRIVFFTLISTFLLLALVVEASATTRTVGVNVGNTFRYSFTVSLHSTDPSATFPSYLVDFNNTQWTEINVTAISGTNVTGQTTTLYKNGTETTMDVWVDVDTGFSSSTTIMDFAISANLAQGDLVYSREMPPPVINETVTRMYLGVGRATNHFNMTNSYPFGDGYENDTSDYYWDKTTGVLVETLQTTTNQTSQYTTTSSVDVQITSSNVWTVPEFPTWTPALLILIAFTSATIVIAKRKQPKTPIS